MKEVMNNGEGKSKGRKKLKLDLSELVHEMDLGDNLELSGYLDTETGEVISMPDSVMRAVEDSDEATEALPDWEQELVETAERILGDEKDRFLPIPRRESREGYELMTAFADTVKSKDLREKLAIALDGQGAFRRFRNVLNHHPDELDRWYAFKDENIREDAVQWLLDHDIEPVQIISGFFNRFIGSNSPPLAANDSNEHAVNTPLLAAGQFIFLWYADDHAPLLSLPYELSKL